MLSINVLEKILEEIEERIKKVNEADNMCRVNAERNRNFESVKYFQSLMFATERAESIIGDIIRSHMDEVENDGWISVEERLPKEPEFMEDSYIVQQKNVIDPFSAYWDGKEWTDVNDDKVEEVIAWQPLPEPYKPKETISVAGMDHIMSRFTRVE